MCVPVWIKKAFLELGMTPFERGEEKGRKERFHL